ncbi:glyoxal oxidase [Cryptococcus neoformans 125.91]|nr:glyoxal oxidase [Cryptococcus neoformans var. grubii AD1-83a]OWZ54142.1 glyoxal oxidase [Cryptococcus neoformans var. grubii 125.91]OXG57605.1 glyoxal oxidase [Cryptococcus neoformans var. grubii MW-RSA1955]OXG62285.1 glyoxal oxidase [Cryptococcus neoformans var. grubii CHC193]OXG67780.1 glyoxal oxidase [Cryptococcus neoformans var. grubii c8]OXH09300.1 glyoxal oxidase [Cryptococcus neoformans var. grubii A5-35-17]OXH10640.1 glyoxal oxidase [Cryptococcus neoformans var. grubii A1-35-8]
MTSLNMATLLALLPLLSLVVASPSPTPQDGTTPGYTANKRGYSKAPTPLSFESVGDTGVSAQQMFLGNNKKVYVIDKAENNPITINGAYGTHPAWATEYDIETNEYRTLDVYSNTFCAGGNVLGNGTWVIFGGNQPVTTGGVASTDAAAYSDTDGGSAIRMINPCTDETCEYIQGETSYDKSQGMGGWLQMTGKRWYPTAEALEDGSLIVIGGDKNGGYVNTAAQDNPTYEFFPPRDGDPVNLQFLTDTLPVNLYPLVWLLPSGKLFMQAYRKTILYDYNTKTTTDLPDMPYATRVYPASAATVMLPLTPANNYTVTLLFCGGSNTTQWGDDGSAGYNVTAVPADGTCVRISPDNDNPQYEDDDYMFEGRSMGQFVILPDGTFWMGNGVAMGTAGYGNEMYSVGQSYGQDPLYMPALYNYSAPKGSRWNRTGLSASANERMYHSTAILLPDSSVLIAGSNPNADFTNNQWRSRTDSEKWYPWYYNEKRPTYSGMPANLYYGGNSFNLTMSGTDEDTAKNTKVVLIRGGFNTHAMGFGQKMLELESTYTIDMNTGNTTIHVSQLPGNPGPTLFQPGPAMFFVVVKGVPSMAEFIMVGNGRLGDQNTTNNAVLPPSTVVAIATTSASASATDAGSSATSVDSSSSSSSSSSESGAAPVLLSGMGMGGVIVAVLSALAVLA